MNWGFEEAVLEPRVSVRAGCSTTSFQLWEQQQRATKLERRFCLMTAAMLLLLAHRSGAPGGPSPHTLQFQRMAHELERLAAEKAPRLVASHVRGRWEAAGGVTGLSTGGCG